MTDCIFCKIAAGGIPAETVFENNEFIAFRDLHPKAPVHILVVPKQHIASLAHLQTDDAALMGLLTLLLPEIAKTLGLNNGFKTLIHTGEGGGQEIFHLHYHLTGTPGA